MEKSNDCEEFAEDQLRMLKSMAGLGYGVKKSVLRRTLPHAKLSLSNAEGELFIEKVRNAFSYIKRKLRDRGSGLHLPMPCKQILKAWSRIGKEKKMRNKSSDETLQPGKADVKHAEQSPTPIMEQMPTHIRETLAFLLRRQVLWLAYFLMMMMMQPQNFLKKQKKKKNKVMMDSLLVRAHKLLAQHPPHQPCHLVPICGLQAEDWENSKYCLNFCPQNFTAHSKSHSMP